MTPFDFTWLNICSFDFIYLHMINFLSPFDFNLHLTLLHIFFFVWPFFSRDSTCCSFVNHLTPFVFTWLHLLSFHSTVHSSQSNEWSPYLFTLHFAQPDSYFFTWLYFSSFGSIYCHFNLNLQFCLTPFLFHLTPISFTWLNLFFLSSLDSSFTHDSTWLHFI